MLTHDASRQLIVVNARQTDNLLAMVFTRDQEIARLRDVIRAKDEYILELFREKQLLLATEAERVQFVVSQLQGRH